MKINQMSFDRKCIVVGCERYAALTLTDGEPSWCAAHFDYYVHGLEALGRKEVNLDGITSEAPQSMRTEEALSDSDGC